MEITAKKEITVETLVNAPMQKVWDFWTAPAHIMRWYNASDDWHAPYAENDLRKEGKFKTTMAAKDGSMGFDFEGVYTNVQEHKLIEYTMMDGRKAKVSFSNQDGKVKVIETFEMENTNSYEMQKGGWQAILDNFKKHVETN